MGGFFLLLFAVGCKTARGKFMASEPGGVASSGLDDENLVGDVASELPSPSLASTWHLQGNQVDQVQDAKQGQPSSHVNFEHVVGAAWKLFDC